MYCEQQSPNCDPKQVVPSEFAPHCPLVETIPVGDGLAEVVLVEVMNEEAELDEAEDGWTDALTALQFPKAALQPASQ